MSKKRKTLTDNIDGYSNTEGMLYETDESANEELFQQLGALAKGKPQREQNDKSENALTLAVGGALEFNGWKLTRVGLSPPQNASHEDYSTIGRMLLQLETSMQWLLGDWLLIGENFKWGETYQLIADEFGYDPHTLKVYKSVCKRVNSYIRMYELSFGHHQLVAPYEENPDVQQFLLQSAADANWSIKKFRETLKVYAPIINQAVSNGWNTTQFEAALNDFNPNEESTEITHKEQSQWAGAKQSWDIVQKVSETLQRGKLPSPKQQAEVKDEIAALREYLQVLEHQIEELSQ